MEYVGYIFIEYFIHEYPSIIINQLRQSKTQSQNISHGLCGGEMNTYEVTPHHPLSQICVYN